METIKEALEPAPEALSANLETLEESDDSFSLWNRYFPSDVPFFKLTLLDQLLRRPYHAVKLEGPFNLKQLAEDNRDRTFRSETSINRSGHPQLDRLLLRLENEVFGYLEADTFTL